SHLSEFHARVVEVGNAAGAAPQRVVVLDQTAFYPLGGGQPCDRGTLAGFQVDDVQIAEDGRILHFIPQDKGALNVGEEVLGRVDPAYRREITQQHTGQHILSQAFFQLFGAETRGFRMTDEIAEIDLTLETPVEAVPDAIATAENLANAIVFDDREIRTHRLTPEEAALLPLRKESFVSDCVRVVEIADFDFSPCGGTHAKRTGEVGLIAVRGWARAKRMVRVEFVCGGRALRDYRLANATANSVARRFSVGRDEADASVTRLLEDHKIATRRLRELTEVAARAEAAELIEAEGVTAGITVVERIFDDRSLDELKLLAHRLVEHARIVALLGTRDGDMARLVFARSADLELDVGKLMRSACEAIGGRGGGKPDFAQGGGPATSQLEAVVGEQGAGIRGQGSGEE
ncbi:MAG: DHHA1 domain-containing protein, partial [Acidobacteriota bacterium]